MPRPKAAAQEPWSLERAKQANAKITDFPLTTPKFGLTARQEKLQARVSTSKGKGKSQ